MPSLERVSIPKYERTKRVTSLLASLLLIPSYAYMLVFPSLVARLLIDDQKMTALPETSVALAYGATLVILAVWPWSRGLEIAMRTTLVLARAGIAVLTLFLGVILPMSTGFNHVQTTSLGFLALAFAACALATLGASARLRMKSDGDRRAEAKTQLESVQVELKTIQELLVHMTDKPTTPPMQTSSQPRSYWPWAAAILASSLIASRALSRVVETH